MHKTTSKEFIGTRQNYAEMHKAGLRFVAINWGGSHDAYRFFENDEQAVASLLDLAANFLASIAENGRLKLVRL
jgi:hypothetical protein